MKAFRILGRNIAESFKGVFRNFSLSLASISCITITLILVGFSIILSYNVNNFTKEIEKDLTIVVFLNRKTTTEESVEIQNKIKDLGNILDIKFQSKEDVRKEMRKESEVFDSIMSQYTAETNPLQDTFHVKVVDINEIGKTADEIKKIEKVELVKYGEGSVEELIKIFDIVKKVTYVVVVALIVVTAFLITNTIKITIQSRRKEIEIMRLVGASNMFIKQPFFFEGIILGFLGSILPIVVCCYGYYYLYDKLGGQLFTAIIKLVKPSSIIYIIMIILVGVGVIVGSYGSYKAVRKYMKI
ncbi:MAG: ABC transporter permease [Tenericutes bacterium]|nr:ABC transporter permease [Mycoplasmatota bacterium]